MCCGPSPISRSRPASRKRKTQLLPPLGPTSRYKSAAVAVIAARLRPGHRERRQLSDRPRHPDKLPLNAPYSRSRIMTDRCGRVKTESLKNPSDRIGLSNSSGRPWTLIWRRGRDSNPRSPVRGTTVFETAPFNRSGTSPIKRGRSICTASPKTAREQNRADWRPTCCPMGLGAPPLAVANADAATKQQVHRPIKGIGTAIDAIC